MIVLTRYYSPFGVHGDLKVGDKKFSTLERPWKGNEQNVSCIPEGVYFMQLRSSPIVQRTSGFEEGWQVMNVPGRTYIMFHPLNWVKGSAGCIGIGRDKDIIDNGLYISDSRESFKEFMEILDEKMEWEIEIRPWMMEYP